MQAHIERSPAYGFHMLRHAAASLFIAHLKWTPTRVEAVMGHSGITMTFDLYGHLFEDAKADRSEMEKIEAAVTVKATRMQHAAEYPQLFQWYPPTF